MNKFLKWLLEIPAEPVSPGQQVRAAITSKPPVLNPGTEEHMKYVKWRADHIKRWLDDPASAGSPQRGHLEAERDMHLAFLRLCKMGDE